MFQWTWWTQTCGGTSMCSVVIGFVFTTEMY